MTKLNVISWGITFGCIWGFIVMMFAFFSSVWNKGAKAVKIFGKVYIGYRPTPVGSFIGAVWGFVDGAITGILIAWIYNLFRT